MIRRRTGGALVLALGAAAAGLWLWWHHQGGPEPVHYLAFERFTGAGHYAEGFSDTLVARLGAIPGLYVVSPDSAGEADLQLRGEVELQGDRLRLDYRIFRRADTEPLRRGHIEGPLGRIFELQDQAVREIAGILDRSLGLDDRGAPRGRPTTDLTAYDYYLQGIHYLRRRLDADDTATAATLLEHAARTDPDFALAWAALCEAHWRRYELLPSREEADAAEAACRKAEALDPAAPQVASALGRLYLNTGRYARAIDAYGRASTADPKNPDYRRGLARAYQKSGRTDLAERTFRRAVSTQPGYWRVHMDLGAFLFEHGRYTEALDAFQRVLDLAPDNAYALSNVAAVYLHMGELERAALALQRSLLLRPTSSAYCNTGSAYFFLGRYAEAAAMYRKAVELAGKDHRMWGGLGEALRQIPGEDQGAAEALREAARWARVRLQVDPGDPHARSGLAVYLAQLGELEAATAALAEALAGDPDDMYVQYNAAKVWVLHDQPERARAALANTLKLGYPAALAERDPDLSVLVAAVTGSGESGSLAADGGR